MPVDGPYKVGLTTDTEEAGARRIGRDRFRLHPPASDLESQKKHPRTFSFEFFPPKTPEGKEKLRARPGSSSCSSNQVLSRSRTAPAARRASARSGRCWKSARRVMMPRRISPASPPRAKDLAPRLAALQATWPEPYRRAARRPAVGARRAPANSATPTSWSNSSATNRRCISSSKSPPIPRFHPQARNAQDDLAAFKRKVDAGANAAITQYFYNADAYIVSSTIAKRWASTCRSSRASCRSAIFRSSRASPTPAARRFRAGCVCKLEELRRRHGLDPRVRARRSDRAMRRPACKRRAGSALLHLNQAGLTTTIWQRLGL